MLHAPSDWLISGRCRGERREGEPTFEKLSPASHWAWLTVIILSRSLQDRLYCLFWKWEDGPLRFVCVCVGGVFWACLAFCLPLFHGLCVCWKGREGGAEILYLRERKFAI